MAKKYLAFTMYTDQQLSDIKTIPLILNSKDEKDSKYVKIKEITSSRNWTTHERRKAVGPSREMINSRLEFQSEM